MGRRVRRLATTVKPLICASGIFSETLKKTLFPSLSCKPCSPVKKRFGNFFRATQKNPLSSLSCKPCSPVKKRFGNFFRATQKAPSFKPVLQALFPCQKALREFFPSHSKSPLFQACLASPVPLSKSASGIFSESLKKPPLPKPVLQALFLCQKALRKSSSSQNSNICKKGKAVGSAHPIRHRPLGVRHQARHPAFISCDPGNTAG